MDTNSSPTFFRQLDNFDHDLGNEILRYLIKVDCIDSNHSLYSVDLDPSATPVSAPHSLSKLSDFNQWPLKKPDAVGLPVRSLQSHSISLITDIYFTGKINTQGWPKAIIVYKNQNGELGYTTFHVIEPFRKVLPHVVAHFEKGSHFTITEAWCGIKACYKQIHGKDL